jgi:hypothetical protein
MRITEGKIGYAGLEPALAIARGEVEVLTAEKAASAVLMRDETDIFGPIPSQD